MSTGIYRLVDSHAHLDEVDGIDAAIQQAEQAGVAAVIAVGQDYESNLKVLELAAKYSPIVLPALGLHPWSLSYMDNNKLDLNLQLIEDNIGSIVGIGEIGLDYHKRVRAATEKEQQWDAFRSVLEMARRYDKAVSVHGRYAWRDSYEIVRDSGVKNAVFHWYAGFSNVLRELVTKGYCISATPAAEYHDEHRKSVKQVPLENLLLETDTPVTYGRETRWESRPADVVRTMNAVAELKGLERSTVAWQTTKNAIRVFGLDI